MDKDHKEESGIIMANERETDHSDDAVVLIVDDMHFASHKNLLCKHSDYFQAMFSGNYVEHVKREIKIDILGADTMSLVLKYMEQGTLDITEIDLTSLASTANILQIRELITLIANELNHRLSAETWIETMNMAEELHWEHLLISSLTYGLVSFDSMKVEYIKCIHTLCLYLSHPSLLVDGEDQVLKFGLEWVVKNNFPSEALLAILGCLDLTELEKRYMTDKIELPSSFKDSLADQVFKWLLYVFRKLPRNCTLDKSLLVPKCSVRVYKEMILLFNSIKDFHRVINIRPCIYLLYERTPHDTSPHYLSLFSKDAGLSDWITIGRPELWGWSLVNWGENKLVLVGGEYKRGSGKFNRDVAVYDMHLNEWINHGVELPPRRHCTAVTLGNQLFIAGGLGKYRLQLATSIIYDLVKRTYVQIADLNDPLGSPVICVHKGVVYLTTSESKLYKYVPRAVGGFWECSTVQYLCDDLKRPNTLISYGDHIYVSSHCHKTIVRFNPERQDKGEVVYTFRHPVVTMCRTGRKLIAFTHDFVDDKYIYAEECTLYETNSNVKVIWKTKSKYMKVSPTAGCCLVLANVPQKKWELTAYTKRYLELFPKIE